MPVVRQKAAVGASHTDRRDGRMVTSTLATRACHLAFIYAEMTEKVHSTSDE